MNIKYSRLAQYDRRRGPVYLVYLNGVIVGRIEATTPSPYPGRSKAQYLVFPRKAGDNEYSQAERHLGPVGSRKIAVDRILEHMKRFKFGRAVLAKASATQPTTQKETTSGK